MADILLIEDDLALRTELEKFLEFKGHQVTCAEDGRQGLCEIQKTAYDVILLDVKLPEMNGTDVLKNVSATTASHPPIIIITGHGSKEMVLQAIHFGAFDFLEKPFTPELLIKTVDRALLEKKQDRATYRLQLANSKHSGLTERESEVAALAALGMSNDEIALKLSLQAETVKSHLKSVFRKMGVSNRTELSAHFRK